MTRQGVLLRLHQQQVIGMIKTTNSADDSEANIALPVAQKVGYRLGNLDDLALDLLLVLPGG